ncbi:MAG: NB-ARC domain-containing protein [Gammaproteobacteria bacterium]
MQTKRVFLASSSELKEDRKEFEIFINRKNKDWVDKGAFIELIVWEDFLDALAKTRLQDEYNKAIQECDIFVMLFWTKVGKYTEEEFEIAFGQFKAVNKPFIFTYFKDAEISTGSADKSDLMSLWAFQEKLDDLGHFYTVYKDTGQLNFHFNQQLDKLAKNGFIELKWDKGEAAAPHGNTYQATLTGSGAIAQGPGATAVGAGGVYVDGNNTGNINVTVQAIRQPPSVPFQAPPPATDHVQRPHELAQLKQYLLDGSGQLLPNTVGLHGFGGAGKTTLARLFCADAAVRQACRDGILWVPLGKNPPEPRAQIVDLVTALTGECSGCATLPGARAQLQAALSHRKVLLVLDDVWDEAQIKDIVEVSAGCARLITTRNTYTLPFEAILVDAKTMDAEDARQLLGAGLPPGQDARLIALADQLGYWPVLLRLANRTLRQRIQHQKMSASKALDAVERDLARKGVLAFDPARDALERDQAVAATVEASLELLDPAERQRYAELAIFPQDVPIPLVRAAQLWQLTAGLDSDQAEDLVASRLDPLSLLDYDGGTDMLRLHDVLHSYLSAKLADKAHLHLSLAERWGDRPAKVDAYAWRWLAFHRAQAAMASEQPKRHALTESLVALVDAEDWQQAHEDALKDLPALRDALSCTLDAAVADDVPLGVPLVVQAADTLVGFRRDHLRPEPIFELARQGDLDGARRRSALFSIDDHWRQVLLLTVAWLAPQQKRDQARKLCDEIQAELGSQAAQHDLLLWIRADLWDEPAPGFLVPDQEADEALIEALLKRVGGGQYDRELIISRGLDPDAQDPDRPPPTRGLYRDTVAGPSSTDTTTRYLAELDGPYLVAYAAKDPTKGTDVLTRYLSVYTNYNYPEYRFSTLWLLLGFVVRLPRADGGPWVQDAVVRILGSALGGGSVEFELGLAIAATALRAQAQDQGARTALKEQAHRLMDEAMSLKPGRGSDIWAHHKRLMLANAQALGWLLGEEQLAGQVLHEASGLADSGFAGYQAPACLALAEAVHVCREGDPQEVAEIDQALEWAQRAAHNVQDPTFCARMTARVNAVRRYWWQGFNLEERARRLAEAGHLLELAALHRVGHEYAGRRPDALQLPHWAADDRTFDGLQRLYQRPKADFLRLSGGERPLATGDEVAVPDPGFAPHLAARLSAETLAQAGHAPLPPERLQLLRSLVPYAVPSPTALDAVLTRLVLAQGRRESPPDLAEATALEAVLARRPAARREDAGSELIAGRLPA